MSSPRAQRSRDEAHPPRAVDVALEVRLGDREPFSLALNLPEREGIDVAEDGRILFDLEDGEVAYLTDKDDRNFSYPPERDRLGLHSSTAYHFTTDCRVEGSGDVELWLIEYDDDRRVAHWREAAVSGSLRRSWITSPRLRRSCLAIRMTGRGALRLGPLVIKSMGTEPAAAAEARRFDASRDDLDLQLFLQLNAEYASKPLVPRPRSYVRSAVLDAGAAKARELRERFELEGKRILEVGCGRGEVLHALAASIPCQAVGVDIERYDLWSEFSSGTLSFEQIDITRESYSRLGTFGFVFSLAVWEHIRHPHAALVAVWDLLEPGGTAYIVANLHRGPKASHRYREVFFPWPHLLFRPEVFRQFYQHLGGEPAGPAWVNRLTAAHYLLYFDRIGFEVEEVWYKTTPIDESFYQRFEDILGQYPRFDLERDFIHAVLRKPS